MADWGLTGLFLSAFLAATILPLSSEATLAALLLAERWDPWALWAAATLGNGLGSVVNWLMGRWALHFQDRQWFPVSPENLGAAQRRFRKYGQWSLLFAWVPLIGDPLTLAAGLLRVRFLPFVLLVFTGKGARYAFFVLLLNGT